MFFDLKHGLRIHADRNTVAVPMVASFLGCMFGGFLYDVFIYTGAESPINTPWYVIFSEPYFHDPYYILSCETCLGSGRTPRDLFHYSKMVKETF